jgi:hypothetical protein
MAAKTTPAEYLLPDGKVVNPMVADRFLPFGFPTESRQMGITEPSKPMRRLKCVGLGQCIQL